MVRSCSPVSGCSGRKEGSREVGLIQRTRVCVGYMNVVERSYSKGLKNNLVFSDQVLIETCS
jgi:hypothetical protein